jgi:hypothetical protein
MEAEMRQPLKGRALVVFVTLSVALVITAAASARPPIHVAGHLDPTGITQKPSGGNAVTLTGTQTMTGGFAGTVDGVGVLVPNESGQLSFWLVQNFTGTTPCGPATVQFLVWGSGLPDTLTGQSVAVHSSVGTMHAHLTFTAALTPTGAVVDYTGTVRCR